MYSYHKAQILLTPWPLNKYNQGTTNCYEIIKKTK